MKTLLATVTLFLLLQEALLQSTYCGITPQHTMCNSYAPGGNCTAPYSQWIPGTADIDSILKWHNDYRTRAASGLENKAKNSQTLPKGCDMCKLKWDKELATIAQRLADQCYFNHDCGPCRNVLNNRLPAVGQNIAISMTTGTANSPFTSVFNGWYEGEVQQFDKSYVTSYVFGAWGHYSQVIWGKTCLIGCGGSKYKDRNGWNAQLVVCNYGPAGNYRNSPTYTVGNPATCCPSGTTPSGSLCA